jgi:hypothetical protein
MDTFLGAVRVPSTSNKAIKPGFLTAIALNVFFLPQQIHNNITIHPTKT